MGTKTFNNYEDLLTFTRASKGHALRPVSYGTELVTNGDFATDSDWTKLGGSTISSGEGHIVSTGSFVSLNQDIGAVTGKIYFVTIDVTVNSGAGVYIGIGGGAIDSRRYDATFTGTHSFALVAGNVDTNVQITRSGPTDSDVDNISVKEVTFDESDGTLTLFEHPNNIPRVEWDAQRNRLGLLVEEARTNLNPRSRPDSNWITSNVTLAENDSTAPDGTESATKITETTATASHYTYAPAASFTIGTTYTISCFVKAGTKSLVQLTGSSGTFGGGLYAHFDVENGAVGSTGSGTTATIQDIGNGWYRCVITGDATATAGASTAGVLYMIESLAAGRGPSFTGSASNYLYAYGLQLEAGSFPTSYIKSNSGSTTTRSADVASIPVADFGYNQSAGTMLIDYLYQSLGSGELGRYLELGGSNPSQDRILLYLSESSENTALQIRTTGGGTQTGLNVSTPIGQFNKVAGGFSKDDVAAVANGGSAVTDTAADIPANIVELDIGSSSSNIADVGVVYIKSINYYPRRLTNAQLQALTEPRSTPTLSLTFDGLESSYTENYIHG